MKINYKIILVRFSFFVLLSSGCNQKDVGNISPTTNPTTPQTGSGTSYYVSDATGLDANNGLTTNTALKTIMAAYNKVVAGDTVFIMNGTYNNNGTTILNITKSGTLDKYITFKNYPGQTPKIYISGNTYNGILINGNYIIIDGVEMMGDNVNISYAGALAAYNTAVGGGTDPLQGVYSSNGISIGGPNTQSKFPHHTIIRNCKIHDFPGGGISAIQADYTTIEYNTIYNNAWFSMYGQSGISILTPFSSDGNTGYKNIVQNNYCYGNKTQIPVINDGRITDGNGIIIDINLSGYGGVGAGFNGRTLVQNNISFNNGGSGIHAFKAQYVDIINNTAYNNGVVTGYPDIFAAYASDVKLYNNIVYSQTGGKANSNSNNTTSVIYDYNLYFNGTTAVKGAHDIVADPQFISASINPSLANFSLKLGSPAINAGSLSLYAAKDFLGVLRPKGAGVDCGAYEVQ